MPTRILLQATDDWHIGRFSRLRDHLASLDGVEVVARHREVPPGEVDPAAQAEALRYLTNVARWRSA